MSAPTGLASSRFGLLALAGLVLAALLGFATRWIGSMLQRPGVGPGFRPVALALLAVAAALALVGLWRDTRRGPALIASGLLALGFLMALALRLAAR